MWLLGVSSIAACGPNPASMGSEVRCQEIGRGVLQALDISPDGRWAAAVIVPGDGVATVARVSIASGAVETIAREDGIIEFAVAVDDRGAVWFEVLRERMFLVKALDGSTTQWEPPLFGYLGLDWDGERLLGVVVDVVDGPVGVGVAAIDTQAATLVNRLLLEVPGAASVAAGGDGISVVAAGPAPGEPATFTFIGIAAKPATISVDDAQHERVGLARIGDRWAAFYRQPSTATIVSRFSDGLPGPDIPTSFSPLSLALTPDGQFAVGSLGGPSDAARVCFGRLA